MSGVNPILWGLLIVATLFALIAVFIFSRFFNLWIQALFSGAPVSMGRLIGMRLRRIDPRAIVFARIRLKYAGIEVSAEDLETHHLAGGDVGRVADALIAAKSAGIAMNLHKAAEIDLAGRGISDASPGAARLIR